MYISAKVTLLLYLSLRKVSLLFYNRKTSKQSKDSRFYVSYLTFEMHFLNS